MLLSVSRRTDIPSFYAEWFFNRVHEGYVFVRNPMNFRQVSRIDISPEVVDGIVFWTKNPVPMFNRLHLLKDYTYYFQFTVTPYGNDVEQNIPDKTGVILPAFQRLSDIIGADKVIWRYDPILLSPKYTIDYHVRAFEKIARQLGKYTKKCTISFIDAYRNTVNNTKPLNMMLLSTEQILTLGKVFAEIAQSEGLAIDTCAEQIELSQFGIGHARCVDGKLFEELLGCRLNVSKDKHQRPECTCAESIDIGMYNTCRNGCLYCYANFSAKSVGNNSSRHNPLSPLLYGDITEEDIVKVREVKSCKNNQLTFL